MGILIEMGGYKKPLRKCEGEVNPVGEPSRLQAPLSRRCSLRLGHQEQETNEEQKPFGLATGYGGEKREVERGGLSVRIWFVLIGFDGAVAKLHQT